jgi:hypothetical protein
VQPTAASATGSPCRPAWRSGLLRRGPGESPHRAGGQGRRVVLFGFDCPRSGWCSSGS